MVLLSVSIATKTTLSLPSKDFIRMANVRTNLFADLLTTRRPRRINKQTKQPVYTQTSMFMAQPTQGMQGQTFLLPHW